MNLGFWPPLFPSLYFSARDFFLRNSDFYSFSAVARRRSDTTDRRTRTAVGTECAKERNTKAAVVVVVKLEEGGEGGIEKKGKSLARKTSRARERLALILLPPSLPSSLPFGIVDRHPFSRSFVTFQRYYESDP